MINENMNSNSFIIIDSINNQDSFQDRLEKYLLIKLINHIQNLIHKTRVCFFEDSAHEFTNNELRNRMLFVQQVEIYMLLKYVISRENLRLITYVFIRSVVLFYNSIKYKYSFEMLYMF